MSAIKFNKLSELAENDLDFERELSLALFKSLKDLHAKYNAYSLSKDSEGLKNIRHKAKPNVALFEIYEIEKFINEGKIIEESKGFDEAYFHHLENFNVAMDQVLEELGNYLRTKNFLF
jgi:hypothetical protein